MSSRVSDFHCGEHAEGVLQQLMDHRESQQFCDIVLISGIDGTTVSAHRVLLSASSDFFSAMFRNPLRESVAKEVTIGEVSGTELQALISFCYSGRIQLSDDNVAPLLAAASLLQLNSVVQACTDFLEGNLHPSNCLGMARFFQNYNSPAAQMQAEAFILEHYSQVCKSDEFFELNAKQLSAIIASDDLHVDSEKDVFNSCMSWIRHDSPNRVQYFPELLALVRLPLLPEQFIYGQVSPRAKTLECKNLLTEAMEWQLLPQSRPKVSSKRTKPRKLKKELVLAIGEDRGRRRNNTFQSYDVRSDEWITWEIELPIHDVREGCAVLDDSLIIAGTSSSNEFSIISHNLLSKKLTTLGLFNTQRRSFGFVVFLGSLYAVGGFGLIAPDNHILNSVERWDPKKHTWTLVCPMNEERFGADNVVALGDYLYAIGGVPRDEPCSVERYDPHANEWTKRASMNIYRTMAGLSAGNGYLYAVGGLQADGRSLSTVERYDPVADEWTMIYSMDNSGFKSECAFLHERLMAAGSSHFRDDNTGTVAAFDIDTNEWTLKEPMGISNFVYNIVKGATEHTPSSAE